MGILIPLILIFFCCLFIWRACDGFERASAYIGRNLSEGVRGGTINAISSSIPELFTTLIALFVLADQDGFAIGIGTTAGSALFNGMIIPAVCILAVIGVTINGTVRNSVDVSTKVILRDGLFLIFAEFLLIVTLGGDKLVWWQGFALMAFYVIYMSYMLLSMKRSNNEGGAEEEEEDEEEEEEMGTIGKVFYWLSFGPILDLEAHYIKERQEVLIKEEKWNGWPLLLTATSVIGLTCWLLVKACEWLGTGSEAHPSYTLFGQEYSGLGLPALFVAVIFASMATSVPDTIISVRDARKGEADDAVANALGSNIFDICFALGFPLFLYTLIYGPIQMAPETIAQSGELRISLFLLTIVAFFIYFVGARDRSSGTPRIRLHKPRAYMLLSLYIAYVVYVVGRGTDAAWTLPITDFLHRLLVELPTFT
ncbi:MAG: sodium:calcium antiporter [Luteolibacter sp.]